MSQDAYEVLIVFTTIFVGWPAAWVLLWAFYGAVSKWLGR